MMIPSFTAEASLYRGRGFHSASRRQGATTATVDALTPQGFGCNGPFDHNPYECDRHCKDDGFRGGYCNALTGWLRCDCYG